MPFANEMTKNGEGNTSNKGHSKYERHTWLPSLDLTVLQEGSAFTGHSQKSADGSRTCKIMLFRITVQERLPSSGPQEVDVVTLSACAAALTFQEGRAFARAQYDLGQPGNCWLELAWKYPEFIPFVVLGIEPRTMFMLGQWERRLPDQGSSFLGSVVSRGLHREDILGPHWDHRFLRDPLGSLPRRQQTSCPREQGLLGHLRPWELRGFMLVLQKQMYWLV